KIPMHDPMLVGRVERCGDLLRDSQHFGQRDRRARDPLGQCLAFYELEDERMCISQRLDPVQRGDVRVVERGEHLRFTLEAREAVPIALEALGQDFERHVTAQPRVVRTKYLAHAARAEELAYLVPPQVQTGREHVLSTPATRR